MTVFDEADFKAAHNRSSNHKAEIVRSKRCACFYCLSEFAPDEVEEWIADGTCAICPRCGIDAVLGDASGLPVTHPIFLAEMRRYWF